MVHARCRWSRSFCGRCQTAALTARCDLRSSMPGLVLSRRDQFASSRPFPLAVHCQCSMPDFPLRARPSPLGPRRVGIGPTGPRGTTDSHRGCRPPWSADPHIEAGDRWGHPQDAQVKVLNFRLHSLSRKRFHSRENAFPLEKTFLLSRKRFPSRESTPPLTR